MLLANLAVQEHEHVCMHKATCRGFSQATMLFPGPLAPSAQPASYGRLHPPCLGHQKGHPHRARGQWRRLYGVNARACS
jgi:hypothetical protein